MATQVRVQDDVRAIINVGERQVGVKIGEEGGHHMLLNVTPREDGKVGHRVAPFLSSNSAFYELFHIHSRWLDQYIIGPDNPGPVLIRNGSGDADVAEVMWVSVE